MCCASLKVSDIVQSTAPREIVVISGLGKEVPVLHHVVQEPPCMMQMSPCPYNMLQSQSKFICCTASTDGAPCEQVKRLFRHTTCCIQKQTEQITH